MEHVKLYKETCHVGFSTDLLSYMQALLKLTLIIQGKGCFDLLGNEWKKGQCHNLVEQLSFSPIVLNLLVEKCTLGKYLWPIEFD